MRRAQPEAKRPALGVQPWRSGNPRQVESQEENRAGKGKRENPLMAGFSPVAGNWARLGLRLR